MPRAIHARGSASQGPFVEVNCTTLPKDLIEAELFGYEKRAYTGATDSKPGLAEAGEGGTLFLDEVGELPLAVQARLLQLIEQKAARRLGGLRTRTIPMRIFAAINRNLETKAESLANLTLEAAERRPITQALTASRGNVSEAARRPGISREAMRYRPQKHGIVPDGLKWAALRFPSPCRSPYREEGIEGVTDLWAEEGTKGTRPGAWFTRRRAGKGRGDACTARRPVRKPASDCLRLARPRARVEKHCAYLYHYVQICISIRGEFPVRKRPTKGCSEPFFGGLAKTLQRQETYARGHQTPHGLAGRTAAPVARKPCFRLLTAVSASRARASTMHICITTRGEFPVSKPPSKGCRETFFGALVKTRNVEKAALSAGVRRNTA